MQTIYLCKKLTLRILSGIAENLLQVKKKIPAHVTLIAVSKTQSTEVVLQAYFAGQKIFGENKVQEIVNKQEQLPKDIEWHFIGHLHTNKVKSIVPFVSLIHSVDSLKLLNEINKQAQKIDRTVNCLLQIYIAREETKFGFSFHEVEALLRSAELKNLKNIHISGLMGMATFTESITQIRSEFRSLAAFFHDLKKKKDSGKEEEKNKNFEFKILSMGMSSDFEIAIEEGSTMVRVGSAIFGQRDTA